MRPLRFAVSVLVVFGGGLAATRPAAAQRQAPYDLVLHGGRVIDPASGLDAVRSIAIRNGRIAAITTARLRGRDTINATGLVVAPGFVDLHAHGQDSASYRFYAHDGVTTALDLEGGALSVDAWYADREHGALINYGVSVGHRGARIALLHGASAVADSATLQDPAAAWVRHPLDARQLPQLMSLIENGLNHGALGVGFVLQQTAGASHEEILRAQGIAARHGVVSIIHLRFQGAQEPRSSLAALQEVLANASVTDGAVHVVHLPATALGQTQLLLEVIDRARARGLDVSTETHPYEAMYQRLSSPMFDSGWQERLGITYGSILWPPTGERLTAESFARYRAQGGEAVIFAIPEAAVTHAIASADVIIAADAVRGRARLAGTHARVLGRYVRERRALSLADAIRKMSFLPARRLEASVPQMRAKGRIQVGADADLTIFDPVRVIDRATFEDPGQYSDGILQVVVGGTVILRNGQLVEGVAPGRAIRRSVGGRLP